MCHHEVQEMADDNNLFGEKVNIVKEIIAAPLDSNKEVCVKVNTQTQVMFMSCHQSAGKKLCLKTANKYFENVTVQICGNNVNRTGFKHIKYNFTSCFV